MSVPQEKSPDRRFLDCPGGFDDFLREQYRGLVMFLRHRTTTTQDAEDVAQESMVKLLRYRASAPAAEWRRLLYRIAINTAHDRFRDARHRHTSDQVPVDECDVASPTCQPDEFAAHQQHLADLRRAILALPPKCRQVYLLRLALGMTNAQIATRCGISVKMVEKHLTKGLAVLRTKVGNSATRTFTET